MKRFIKKLTAHSLVIVLVLAFTLSVAVLVRAAATVLDLGTAEDFAVLAGGAVTDSNPAIGIDIIGNVGLHPAAGTFITGLSCTQVTGTIYDNNAGYLGGFDSVVGCLTTDLGGVGILIPAKNDLSLAYNDAEGQALDSLVTASTTDSFASFSYVLSPGVYNSPSTMGVPIALELNGGGDPNAVFIFQASTSLNTVSDSEITLTNGTQACNVFWQVGSSATLATSSSFAGTIMAAVSITDAGGSTVDGRLLADADQTDADTTGAVTLNNTHITVPTCVVATPTPTPTPTPAQSSGGSSGGSIVRPIIDVVKVASPLALPAGPGSVTYTFTVRNTGPVAMTNVTLNDDSCATSFVSGDTNDNDTLEVSETWTYTCSTTLSATHTNSVTATGWANGFPATDTAVATVVVGGSATPTPITGAVLPGAGFGPDNSGSVPWNIGIAGFLVLVSTSVVILRRRTV